MTDLDLLRFDGWRRLDATRRLHWTFRCVPFRFSAVEVVHAVNYLHPPHSHSAKDLIRVFVMLHTETLAHCRYS